MDNDKIRRIIEEGRRHRERCCVVGPTGPRGPQGPATITVGSTATGEPGTNAQVTNSGTSENAILNFTIPRGETGATGPIGPQGLQGETGATGPTGPQGLQGETPILEIGTVTTGEPGTQAAASITGTAPNYILNLTIPQGPTGPSA